MRPETLLLMMALLTGCVPTDAGFMTDPCKMTLKEQHRDRKGAIEIVVLAPDVLCMDPARATDYSPFAGTARLTNISSAPVKLRHASGSVAFRAFSSSRLAEPDRAGGAEVFAAPPLHPSEIAEREVELKPGESVSLTSWGRHQATIVDLMIQGLRLDDSDAMPGLRQARPFIVDYALSIVLNGDIVVSDTYRTDLVARLPLADK